MSEVAALSGEPPLGDVPESFVPLHLTPSMAWPTFYDGDEFIRTASGNKVSRKTLLRGSQNITISGRSVFSDGVVLRGDLADLRIGRYVWIGENTVIHPSTYRSNGKVKMVPMTIGDYVIIGANSVVYAAAIGSNVEIGENCVIGNRCIIKENSTVLPGTVLSPDTVVPFFTKFGGKPGVFQGQMPEASQLVLQAKAKTKYETFQAANPKGLAAKNSS